MKKYQYLALYIMCVFTLTMMGGTKNLKTLMGSSI